MIGLCACHVAANPKSLTGVVAPVCIFAGEFNCYDILCRLELSDPPVISKALHQRVLMCSRLFYGERDSLKQGVYGD